MSYSYEQIGTLCITLGCTSDVKVGHVCRMYGSDCICKAEDGRTFDGVVNSKRNNCAGVIVRGFVTVPYTGTAPNVGSNYLQSNGEGGVCAAEEGKLCLIVNVDTINKIVTFLM